VTGRAVVRLSGDFHRVLAGLAGNAPLTKLMQDLTVRTCLAIVANRASTESTCREDEHARIVQAIAAGDARRAMKLMTEHLNHIERSLDIAAPPEPRRRPGHAAAGRSRGTKDARQAMTSTAFDLTLDAVTQHYRGPPPRPWTK
jgi:hypothetical protein